MSIAAKTIETLFVKFVIAKTIKTLFASSCYMVDVHYT
jgi:hypothetical protein